MVSKILVMLSVTCTFDIPSAYNLLGICPSSSYSHQQPFQALMKALAARGHNVTVISTIPLKKPVKNYYDVDLSFTYRRKDCTGLRHMGAFTLLHKNMKEANDLCEEQLFSPAIENLITKNKTFDAVIIEQLWYQCYYALVKHYNFPTLIGFLSVGNLPYAMDSVGNPDDPVFNPDMAYPFTNRMTTWEIIWNVLYTSWTRLYYRYRHLPRAQRVADRWEPGTSVYDIDRNFSLVILGNNHIFGYPKPLLPNVIEVHSLQITGSVEVLPEVDYLSTCLEILLRNSIIVQAGVAAYLAINDDIVVTKVISPGKISGTLENVSLPKEIRTFLEGAPDGVVYFSLGSNLQSHQLPSGTLSALCKGLGSLRQRVLWKDAAAESIVVRPPNVKFVKWAPQQAVLAHPKVVVYVMQGGLQSLQEAVYYSVPVVAIPFFGDQHFNGRKIQESAIGLTLDINQITEKLIVDTLTEVASNKTYYENIKMLSAILKDEQVKPLDKAVWNVEHVLKFPNSQHLHYPARDISWINYYAPMIFIHICSVLLLYSSYKILFSLKGVVRKFSAEKLRIKDKHY